jgi:hypothetical protein
MKRGLILPLVLAMLTVQCAQGKEKGLPREVFEPGSNGVMLQLLAVAKAGPAAEPGEERLYQSITEVRGGNGSKVPFGQYLVSPFQKFSSEYTKESAESMCQFSYALHRFVVAKGRDYDSFTLNRSKVKQGISYLSANEQQEFARSWWSKRKSFVALSAAQKDKFIEEAVIDGTNLYGWYARRVYGTASYEAWQTGAVLALLKAKPHQNCE